MRSRLFDFISNQMTRGQNTDKCLDYVHTLIYHRPHSTDYGSGTGVRDRSSLVRTLPPHTIRNIQEGLSHVSTEASDRGIIACKLERELLSCI